MRITYTLSGHAVSRQRERAVTHEQIDAALNDPATVMPARQPGRRKYVGRPDNSGRQVVVVASDPPDRAGRVRIVTCYLQ